MTFFPEKKQKRKRFLVDESSLVCGRKLYSAVKSARKIPGSKTASSQSEPFRLLRDADGISQLEISLVVDWYCQVYGSRFLPVCYSSDEFRKKYNRIHQRWTEVGWLDYKSISEGERALLTAYSRRQCEALAPSFESALESESGAYDWTLKNLIIGHVSNLVMENSESEALAMIRKQSKNLFSDAIGSGMLWAASYLERLKDSLHYGNFDPILSMFQPGGSSSVDGFLQKKYGPSSTLPVGVFYSYGSPECWRLFMQKLQENTKRKTIELKFGKLYASKEIRFEN